jgi:hypothetical protein
LKLCHDLCYVRPTPNQLLFDNSTSQPLAHDRWLPTRDRHLAKSIRRDMRGPPARRPLNLRSFRVLDLAKTPEFCTLLWDP